ncbi:MAG TPA: DNA-directed RNA polymerase subunit alpha C-terminal domain-containing protein [Candidatus Saccharimonadales bacterium]|nr:DNA-directed RNA polymerase subunit alpha C-terminal domain-containing protein [Candidatus Saccharimonadales bacterium]
MEKLSIPQLAEDYTFDELTDAMMLKFRAEIAKTERRDFARELAPEPSCFTYALRIEELDFSQRTFNCLRRAFLLRLVDLAYCSEDDLRSIRSFGKKCLLEVKDRLAEEGLTLSRLSIGRFKENGNKLELFLKSLQLEEKRPDLDYWHAINCSGRYPGLYYHAIVMLPQYGFPDPFHLLAEQGFLPPA